MLQIKEINKRNLDLFLNDVKKALDKVGNLYGVTIQLGNSRYSSCNVTTKFEMSVNDKNGSAITRESQNFRRYAKRYNLDPSDLGKIVILDGEKYEITGLKTRNHKLPILMKLISSGKVYKFHSERIQRALGRKTVFTRINE